MRNDPCIFVFYDKYSVHHLIHRTAFSGFSSRCKVNIDADTARFSSSEDIFGRACTEFSSAIFEVMSSPLSSAFLHFLWDSQETVPISRRITVVQPWFSDMLSTAEKPTYLSLRPRQDRDSFSGTRTYQPKPYASNLPVNFSSFPMEQACFLNQS